MTVNQSILFIIHRLGYGGAEKNLIFVANGFAQMGYKVFVYTYEDEARSFLLDEKVTHLTEKKVCKIRGIRRFIQLFQIRKVIKENKPDVVISFLNFPNLLSILASLFLNTTTIISERGDPYRSVGAFDKFRQYLYNFSDGAIFQTDGARDYFNKRLIEKSCVIPNPVMLQANSEHVSERKNEIAYVARFEMVQKRQDLMLEAFRKVVDIHPNIELVFYGDGPDEQQVRDMVYQLSLSNHVRFQGVVDHVTDKIQSSKMFVLTSDYEGIPNALIEAMSVGLPVIATDCSPGGARMLITDKENGRLVRKGDSEAIADAILHIIENNQIAEEYGHKAREIVLKYKPENILKMWEAYIKKTIGDKNVC